MSSQYNTVTHIGHGGKGSDYDYANTFSVGKSFGRVRQNNHGGNNHKLKVDHVGSGGRVRQNNFGGEGHDGRIDRADAGSDISVNNCGDDKCSDYDYSYYQDYPTTSYYS